MKVPMNQISYDGNFRTVVNDAQIDGLAQTMHRIGQQVPAQGRMVNGRCILTDGMRRYLAARKLGWTTLEVSIEEDEIAEDEMLEKQIVLNVQRADWPILDKARSVSRLIEMTGCNASEVARRLGISNASVTRLLSLLALPQEVQRQVASGKLAVSTAYELSRMPSGANRAALIQAASNGKLSREAATERVKKMKKPRRPSGHRRSSRIVAPVGNGWSVTVSGSESSLDGFISCLETALGSARKARTKGLTVGTYTKMLRDTVEQRGAKS